MTLPKLKIKTPKVKLSVVLWAVFLLAILLEAFVLYSSLYLSGLAETEESAFQPAPVTRVDFRSYNEAIDWVAGNDSYELPDYTFESADLGRENPFAEYR